MIRNFNMLMRRTHLYLAMILLPWFLMYGVSALVIAHGQSLREFFIEDSPKWTPLFDKEYVIDLNGNNESLRKVGERILEDNHLEGAFNINRKDNGRVNIDINGLRNPIRLRYYPAKNRLVAEKKQFLWIEFLTRMHVKGGFQNGGWVDNFWAVIVDAISIAILIWIATGIYLWWKIQKTRFWGTVALLCGAASFAIFMLTL